MTMKDVPFLLLLLLAESAWHTLLLDTALLNNQRPFVTVVTNDINQKTMAAYRTLALASNSFMLLRGTPLERGTREFA